MSAIRRVTVNAWKRLKVELYPELFGGDHFDRGRFVFRGVGDADWTLMSSFDRFAASVPLSTRPLMAKELLEAFVDECEGDAAVDPCPGPWELQLAVAQHYGLPTRALDWTESPYIAAYFAFADVRAQEGTGQVAMWALVRAHEAWSGGGAEIFTSLSRHNERMLRQQGVLTYLTAPHDTLEAYVEGLPDQESLALIQFRLPRSEASAALADLRAMGISSTRLFPDRTGAARAAVARSFG
jgi:hypothetical protein